MRTSHTPPASHAEKSAEPLWLLLHEGALLLRSDGTLPQGATPPAGLPTDTRLRRLPGTQADEPCYYAEWERPEPPEGYRLVELRKAYKTLPRNHYDKAGKARELLYWDKQTRYCGACGGTMVFQTDISKRCTRCGREVWPGLAVAAIVAVTRGEEILLVQSKAFKADYMGLVSGYVETGETLEECVRREVQEETGLQVRDIRYYGSQAWPYPSTLMAGFTATYAGGELTLQRDELSKGGWYTAETLPAVPARLSLARRLIDDWLARQGKAALSQKLKDF